MGEVTRRLTSDVTVSGDPVMKLVFILKAVRNHGRILPKGELSQAHLRFQVFPWLLCGKHSARGAKLKEEAHAGFQANYDVAYNSL